jgi:hypothetical protein
MKKEFFRFLSDCILADFVQFNQRFLQLRIIILVRISWNIISLMLTNLRNYHSSLGKVFVVYMFFLSSRRSTLTLQGKLRVKRQFAVLNNSG